jgi:hypothetical protein
MSILDEIREHVQKGNLFEVAHRDLRASSALGYRRRIFVSSEIEKAINGRKNESAFRKLSAQFQNFMLGRTIPIALEHDHKHAEWARLDPAGCEVWETRVRHEQPELRVLGRFADIDIFVTFNLYEGGQLKGKRAWDTAKARCQTDWAVLFPHTSPVFGSTANDYVTTNFTLI